MVRTLALLIFIFLTRQLIAQEAVNIRDTPLEQGGIRGTQRIGTWRYYDYPGELGLEINYDSMQVRYMHRDTTTYFVEENGQWVKTKLLRPCRFHGSRMLLHEHFLLTLSTPYELTARARRKQETIQTVLTFDVGQDGAATNPQLGGYTGFGMGKMLMSSFQSAPNSWIPGIKMDGTPATCRFGVSVKICPDTCSNQGLESDAFRLIYSKSLTKRTSPFSDSEPWTSESTGIQFSPNNQWIAVDAALMAGGAGRGLYIASTNGGEINRVDYGFIKNAYWLDDVHVAFKYRYSISRSIHALYNHKTRIVATRKDSLTFFDRVSPDGSLVCVASRQGKANRVSTIDMNTGYRKDLNVDGGIYPFPLLWSPDQKAILIKGRKEGLDVLIHYSIQSGHSKQLPVLNAEPCGWSLDGNMVYIRRTNFPFANYHGELFSVDLRTMQLTELTGKVEGMLFAEYSAQANKFLMLRKGNLYLQEAENAFDPVKIVDNVSTANWSRNGRQIAYIAEKGTLLCVYDVISGQTKILFNQFTGKK